MIPNIITLTLNDLAIAIKNKTIFLIFFIPIFVFGTMNLVDKKSQSFEKINLALISNEAYLPEVTNSLKSADKIFNITYVENADEGKSLIKKKSISGLLLNSKELIVLKKEALATLSLVENLNALQSASEKRQSWISTVLALQTTDLQKESLPTWILMLVLLVGFVIMPTQVAEEKEKRLLASLLQTPMREIEWILAKAITGIILTGASLFILHIIGDFKTGFNPSYIVFIIIASFCFSSYGILLGFLCRTQASARILGVIFYLPHLLPSALSDFSRKMDGVAPLLPSYHLYESVKLILFDQVKLNSLGFQSMYLFLIGLVTFTLSYYLMKKRWLM